METENNHRRNGEDWALLEPVLATRRPFYYVASCFLLFTVIAVVACM